MSLPHEFCASQNGSNSFFPGCAPRWRRCFSVTWFDTSAVWVCGCIMTDCLEVFSILSSCLFFSSLFCFNTFRTCHHVSPIASLPWGGLWVGLKINPKSEFCLWWRWWQLIDSGVDSGGAGGRRVDDTAFSTMVRGCFITTESGRGCRALGSSEWS